ncbi:MAG: glycine--tRNA ligase subunit alpha [Candidatus Acididesulfobacter diazotrophicus]|uniref:Glycine--tRNA ligase alpha subunit n=1 Tax=Candidatus Acididesulfobacter diazotrophicus TaxID=2597226 RepID=A0A519BJS1_9DELT|nr:MAG: glycine--tRNA ligase subunit alpha [Candidatus Acididesulfobacter diazotrophicus]
MNFQNLIFKLQKYWSDFGCVIMQPYDMEVGAGTFSPYTFLKCLEEKNWKAAYVQPSRRPADGRYGENPNRLARYYQFQVILQPYIKDIQEIYLKSLKALSINSNEHDIRFIEDDWESPTLGAWGLGWEVWIDGMEISQFTFFQQIGGVELKKIAIEITYGLERIAMYLQEKDSVFDLSWNDYLTYGDIHKDDEYETSKYNFELASADTLFSLFNIYENEAKLILSNEKSVKPAYEYCLKCSHVFNLLDARGFISVSERMNYILRVRTIAERCAIKYKNKIT